MAEGSSAAPPQRDGLETGKLRIGMWNADKMQNKMYMIRWLISKFDFDVFVIVESRLMPEVLGEIEIAGYEHHDFPCCFGPQDDGGIVIYFRETLLFKAVSYEHPATNIQYVVIRISLPDQTDYLDLVAVYNPSSERPQTLYRLLRKCLDLLNTDIANVMVLGNFNIDLKNSEICEENRTRLRDPYRLHEHIRPSATHVGVQDGVPYATHIHHIYYPQDRRLCVIKQGVIHREINNHYPIFCVLGVKLNQKSGLGSQLRLQSASQSVSLPPLESVLYGLESKQVSMKTSKLRFELVVSISCSYKKCSSVKFSNQDELKQHYIQHHSVCPLPCNKILESKESLVKHQKKCEHCKSTLFKCHYAKCRAVTVGSPEELKKHYKEKHAICPIPCNDILFNNAKLAKHQLKCEKFLAIHKPRVHII